jgi:hypothetical protein
MSKPDPRGGSSSTGADKRGTPAAGLDPVREVQPDRNQRLNDQIDRSSSSARSGPSEEANRFKDKSNENRRGNIRDPDPNKPDPEGIPRAGP